MAVVKLEPRTSRRLSNWIETFINETEGTSSPLPFRRWAAILAISGALERKVYTFSRLSKLFPNLYTVLTGPPGVGKTAVVDVVRKLWKRCGGLKMAASSVSHASLIDELHDAYKNSEVNVLLAEPVEDYNTLLVAINELETFMTSYQPELIAILTDLYDCKEDFAERKRKLSERIEIARPSLTFLAGTTPGSLADLLKDGAWDKGFASRTIFVYSGEIILGDIFVEGQEEGYVDLGHDLKLINKLRGKYVWEEDAAKALTAWYKGGGIPRPTHPRLMHYMPRRAVHLIKLSMIAAAAASDELIIRTHHYGEALNWLLEAETWMPEIFKAGLGSDRKIMDDTWHYVYGIFVKEKRPVVEARVLEFLARTAPVHSVGRLLEVMVQSNMVKKRLEKEGMCYEPLGK